MADNINPDGGKTTSSNLLPKYFRSDANKKFLQATIDQLIQPGTVKKINGYVGRENAKASSSSDVFVAAADQVRQNYQLEPSFVVKDKLGNTTFFRDYIDYINQLSVFGSNTTNHSRVNKQEFYSWDPHIDWDKFVNFQNYYWLPYGPDVVKITGNQQTITSTYAVSLKAESDNNTYIFAPNGATQNPSIKLYRGQTYNFEINSPGNPFTIKTKRSQGNADVYQNFGLINNGVEAGVISFTVPIDAPDILYYVSQTDIDLGGIFEVLSIDENTLLNVDTEILGKKTYKLFDGTELSNGMKVSFVGKVTPSSYATGQYYVEGVGESIRLVDEAILELLSPYTSTVNVPYDSTPFESMPFGEATTFAGKKDYVVINRGSYDHNPWSRYNRWFHIDVIQASAKYNGKVPNIDQTSRAVRPIIEFESNIKLFNFGTHAIPDVDLIDDYTVDVFSNIEGQLGYNIDGISLAQGQRILFTADTDVLVKNKIYQVDFMYLDGQRRIHLVEQEMPTSGQVVLIRQGTKNQGLSYWYNGTSWALAQQKTAINQAPMFDIVDNNGISYGDRTVYDGSTFTGTKIFSYKVGTGTADASLGFALSYKNISNIGDIVFNFNLASDTFQYKNIVNIITKNIDVGYLVKTLPANNIEYVNGWQKSVLENTQAAVRIYKNTNKVNNFELDIFENKNDLNDLVLKLYVNGIRLPNTKWSIADTGYYKTVVLSTDILTSDVLTIKAYAAQPINSNGFYEIPLNLQNNPLNNKINDFTLGEVIDHVGSIVENLPSFVGTFPGAGNLKDLGNITPYGTRFVQHSGPASLSLYHITSETNNIIKAIETARDAYGKFKRNFITVAETLGIDSDPVRQVNLILQTINKDKPKTAPFYFSDMVPYSAGVKTELTVVDYRIKTYPLSATFNLDSLSNRAVLVYLNNDQLLYDIDYTFNDQGFVVISASLQNDDAITIYEFENTNGCFIPPTPTKLGIWPKYEPKLFLNTSLLTPVMMIQGHDGSLVRAYGDYRDNLILELEKRIYNNIKVQYDTSIFDVNTIIPQYNKQSDYSLSEFDTVLAPSFYKWANLIDRDFTKPLSYDRNDSLTFNYKDLATPDGVSPLPGYWKGVYRWLLGTDRPNICPWEMLGFSIEPKWWKSVYGPAPYTSDNLILWDDLAEGIVRKPGVPPTKNAMYERPYLKGHIPVDSNGQIKSPLLAGLATGTITNSTAGDYVFGDVSPVESAWRTSSYYPFSVILTFMLLQPSKAIGLLLDRSRIVRNLAGQLVYKDTGVRITPYDINLPSIYSSKSVVYTSGIINYLVDHIVSDNLRSYNQYTYDLNNITANLSYRVGAFTSKEKFNLLLDSKTPLSSGSVFVPPDNYNVIINSSSAIKKINYSAVIVTNLSDGFTVKGYSKTEPYFKYYPYTASGLKINVGGISESFSSWTPNSQYAAGKIVTYNGHYYRVKALHTTSETFNPVYYQSLPSLPVSGGREAFMRKAWDRTSPITIPYGTKFSTVQEVVDFLLGYGEYLKDQGFVFDDFNTQLNAITNWETSAKEFLFWTTQNWSTGSDKWQEWLPNTDVDVGTIVRYDGDYYQALRFVPASQAFDEAFYAKLNGLSNIGSSVISLSPSASKITFSTPLSVVDDIRNPFNPYEIFNVDGTPLQANFLNNYREDNAVSYVPTGDNGVYGASFYLVQKEHVVILDNTTMFNDTIYSPESGYRQERIKVSGYVSSNWQGSFNVPGFIFDQANIQEWEPWTDYALGDIVKYKQFYFSAGSKIAGSEVIDVTQWIKLDQQPTAQLLPNWTYKASQFEDFYSLDSDNFDPSQQAVAQHLVGYQKRQYLNNIIQDDVSEFKFYQGMIVEKGTQNVLNKLFDVLSADGQESVKFYEEWALRVGQYGASSAFDNIEFIIDESSVKNNPQGFELVNQVEPGLVDFIVRQTPNDIYLKPIGYNNAPWPVVKNYNHYLRTPGYVRPNEVKLTVTQFDDVLLADVTTFVEGDYVWAGFEGREWNVYRFTRLPSEVVSVKYDSNVNILTLKLTKNSNLAIGSIIAIDQTTEINGFYKVVNVTTTDVSVSAKISNFTDPFTEQSKIVLATFVEQRVKTVGTTKAIDRADTVFKYIPQPGELIWTDDKGDGKWATWQYNTVYGLTEIVNTAPQEGLSYGRKILLNHDGNIAIITNSLGEVLVFDKSGPNAPWLLRQTITAPVISKDTQNGSNATPDSFTGDVLAISADSQWLATGTPKATNVSSKCRFNNGSLEWSATVTQYFVGDIVTVNMVPYQALQMSTNLNPRNPVTQTTYWKQLKYIPVDVLGTNSTLSEQGVISIYKKDSSNIFTLVATIISPSPAAGERFGSSLVFGNNTLFIGANGANAGAGTVYHLSYLTTVQASSSYNPIGSVGQTIVLSSTTGIEAGMYLQGTGFNSSQYVSSVVNGTTITINVPPDSTPSGIISFVVTGWNYDPTVELTPASLTTDSNFGSIMSISADGSVLAISAPGVLEPGKVFIYRPNIAGTFVLAQTISGTDVNFGISTTISDNGTYIAIGSIFADRAQQNQGAVFVYKQDNAVYSLYQELTNIRPESSEFFGSKVAFMNDYETIVVYSKGADSFVPTSFDNRQTTFDDNLTRISDIKEDAGRIDVYDMYNTKWVYSESLANGNDIRAGYSTGFAVGSNHILAGAPYGVDQGLVSGRVHEYLKNPGTKSWTIIHQEIDRVDLSKIKRAFLYDRTNNKLITYLDVIDSTQGKIPGIADAEIKYKTFYDPAIYSKGNTTVNVDDGMAWTKNYVGSLWWDLRTAKFYDSYDNSSVYRNATWNTLFPGASIDVYEWVETTLTPTQWNEQADTEAGIALGISGTTLYGNDVYSVVRKYDTVSQTFKNTYYYWVKNKKTTPNTPSRRLSASEVTQLISNPRGYGYRYLALTGNNSFSLVNIKPLLRDTNIVLSVEYWTSDNTDKKVHSQWKVINDSVSSTIPQAIEEKWFDSLCGKDSAGRLVPDTTLPPKLKYGIENRPRQGMFINRFEALKQFIEETNRILANELIVDNKNISNLEMYEAEPSKLTGLYDAVYDTDTELQFVNIGSFNKPSFTAQITDGRITGINIINSGSGYINAPYFTISGSGSGAVVRAKLSATKGQIIGFEVLNSGYGYTSDTLVTVRNYSVLVHADTSADGKWSIYSYEPTTLVWSRVQSQSYDVRNYWNYIDWYATGYSQFTAINHSVNSLIELKDLDSAIGQVIKIRTTSTGTWMLLQRYAMSDSVDWTQSYKVVGREKGTIQFVSGLYEFIDSPFGYDGSLYDSGIFDNSASNELRIILNTLKDKILTDTLRQKYLDLFFASVRYVLSEQSYVDWVFKTSFVKAQHNVGKLKQKVTYNNDNLSNFEDYIDEVKPYRTKIREYVSSYNSVDNGLMSTSDFDLAPVFSNGTLTPIDVKVVNGVIQSNNNAITTYPWKHWYDNVGFRVTELVIADSGSGYLVEPVVRIISDTGSGATARAFISNGRVNRIVLLTNGTGYLSAPTVVIDGGLSSSGKAARVIAKIGDSVIRSNLIKMKFDRVTQNYFISRLEETETFSGETAVSGSRLQFPLRWAPDLRIGKTQVLVNDIEILRANYTLSIVSSTARGYTSYSGRVTFKTAPAKGSTVVIRYIKDWSMLNAADRIQYYYDPATGELGKDLAQLMTGVDYGGVVVNGLGFDFNQGWGSSPYYSDKWDSFDPTFDDYIVTVPAGTHSFTMPYVPPAGTEVNLYYSGLNKDQYAGDDYTLIYNFNVYDIAPIDVVVTRNVQTIASATNVEGSTILTVASTAHIKVNDVITTNNITGTITALNGTTEALTVSSVAGLFVGDKIKITGNSFGGLQQGQYYIKTIVGSTITIGTSKAGSVPINVNTATGSMTFTVVNPFNTAAIVKRVVNSTQVELNQIIFNDIPSNTTITFTRTLVDPVDCRINGNGTVVLNSPIGTGSSITISAFINPVRLDDSNYSVTGVAKNELSTKQLQLATINNDYNTLLDAKATSEAALADLNVQLYNKQFQLNALNVALSLITPSDPQYDVLVSEINILVNHDIPAIESSISAETANLATINNNLDTKLAEKVAKEAEVAAAQAALNNLPVIPNTTAIMQTFVSDGQPDNPVVSPQTKTFTLSSQAISNFIEVFGYDVQAGDQFILRKTTSDGSIKPQDADYDTALIGGDISYSSATGLAPDDIIVDGDGFVTPTTSPATEEVVPGQVVDAVAIKVYDRPSSGSAKIKVDSYITDGTTTDFKISQQPNSPTAVIVKFNNGTRDSITNVLGSVSTIATLNDDYTVDYRNRLIKFNTAPPAGKLLSIFSFGFNGSNILDLDHFIADGTSTEFVTKAPWVTPVNYLVYVDGLPAQPGTPALFETDSTYDSSNRIGLKFSIPPTSGALISYVIVSGSNQTFSISHTERLQGNGSTTYDLSYQVGDSLPAESNMIVRVDQSILKGPNNSYFKITGNKLNYTIDPAKFLPYTVSVEDIVVLANGTLLNSGVDYVVDLSGITVKITSAIRKQYLNGSLVVSIKRGEGYIYIPPTSTTRPRIRFAEAYDNSHIIEVVSSYKHDILDIERTAVNVTSNLSLVPDTPEYYSYKGVSGGIIQLDRTVSDDNYVWVLKNNSLLTPSADFKLNEDKKSITLANYPNADDEFTLITFGSNVLTTGVSYMQFKDMLNRVIFKRLSANKRTRLAKDLKYNDITIEVEDATNFDIPSIANNKPGIIEIRGERIEYFTKNGNVLGQLRRGTLGTGVPTLHKTGSFVQDIGASETIPYIETSTVEQVKSDGTNIVPLSFVPNNKNEIEVFVGGYSSNVWATNVSYAVNDIVEHGTYTYRCVSAHTSSTTFAADSANWVFFVGNIRLRKSAYSVHNVNVHPESPEGDVTFDADFTVDGTSSSIRLKNLLTFGTRVTVVKRTGVAWDSTTSILNDEGKIARFLKAEPGIWYEEMKK